MANFRRAFKPTFEEQLKDYLYLYHMCMKSYENKECISCKHCICKEELHIGGLIGVLENCALGENNTSKDCNKYMMDEKYKIGTFNMIKNFIKNIK